MKTLQNETGRSMVEMLGVLAIIGVLSIGGIQGYTYAMNKYRANNVLNEMNIASLHLATTLLSSRNAQKMIALGDPYDSGTLTHEAYPFDYGCGNYDSEERSCHQEETGFWAKISDVPEKVCQQILSEAKHLPNIVEQRLNGVAVEDGTGCEKNNEIMLLFNADGSGELAKDCGNGAGEEPEEPTPIVSCPKNTSEEGQGGLATTLTDTVTGKVLNCYCIEVDTKYTNGTCETLPETCSSNTDCNRGEYCDITDYGSTYCTKDTSGMMGSCRNAQADLRYKPDGVPFWVSNKTMMWWSAKLFCQALGKNLVSVRDFGCAGSFDDGERVKNCYKSGTTNLPSDFVAIKESYGSDLYVWTDTDFDSCENYIVEFMDHLQNPINPDNRNLKDYVVCK